jgi:hypothetical protein
VRKVRNPKHEIRNNKQITITEARNPKQIPIPKAQNPKQRPKTDPPSPRASVFAALRRTGRRARDGGIFNIEKEQGDANSLTSPFF